MAMKHPYIEQAELIEEMLKADTKLLRLMRKRPWSTVGVGQVLMGDQRKRLKSEAKRLRRLAELDIEEERRRENAALGIEG